MGSRGGAEGRRGGEEEGERAVMQSGVKARDEDADVFCSLLGHAGERASAPD